MKTIASTAQEQNQQTGPYVLDPMRLEDVPEVQEIERESFSMTWPPDSYARELRENRLAHYLVLRLPGAEPPSPRREEPRRPFPLSLFPRPQAEVPPERPPRLAAYGGFWLMVDEAHITSIAVRRSMRGQGLGELMLVGLIDWAIQLGARWISLEVRVSNYVAQNLYRKYGFKQTGVRPRYYSDNQEDALVMWTDDVRSAGFQALFQEKKRKLAERLWWEARY